MNLKEINFNADIVHICGTENWASLAAFQYYGKEKCVISIQGLIGEYKEMYIKEFPEAMPKTVISSLLPKYPFTRRALASMQETAMRERILLSTALHFIGRTDWDYGNIKRNNKVAKYYFCNEILRKEFYSAPKWTVKKCERESIFLSQICSPIKGFDNFLAALTEVKKNYANVKVYVASGKYSKRLGVKGWILSQMKEWDNEINYLLDKYDMRNNFVFLDGLNVQEMIHKYLMCNVFVCSSRIENSCNSICEAKLLGVPTVASFVGGSGNMITHNKDGFLYNYMEPKMLAHYIQYVFEHDDVAERISQNAIITNEIVNNPIINTNRLLEIYHEVIES